MEQLLNLVRTVAPSIASAVGGPLAGMATKAISEALLGSQTVLKRSCSRRPLRQRQSSCWR